MDRFFSLPRQDYVDATELRQIQGASPTDYYHRVLESYPVVGPDVRAVQLRSLAQIQGWRAFPIDTSDSTSFKVDCKDCELQSVWQSVGDALFNEPFRYTIQIGMRRPAGFAPNTPERMVIGKYPHNDASLRNALSGRPVSLICATLDSDDSAPDSQNWTTRIFDLRGLDAEAYVRLERQLDAIRCEPFARRHALVEDRPFWQVPADRLVLMPSWLIHRAGNDPALPDRTVQLTHARLQFAAVR